MRQATNNDHLREWLGLREGDRPDHVPVALGYWSRNPGTYNFIVWSVPARRRERWYDEYVFDWRRRIELKQYHRYIKETEPDDPALEL